MQRHERARLVFATLSVALLVGACSWDPRHPFDREAPEVNKALGALDAGDGSAAASMLEDYLGTGSCDQAKIGAPPLLRKRPDGTFDLGLSLFGVAESFGRRFGEEEVDSGLPTDVQGHERADQVECALAIVRAIAGDPDQPIELRARARYLEGNLLFLQRDYESAVRAYDEALVLVPGVPDGGDPIGRDAAWNRAIALRRIEDRKDAGDNGDSASDASQDSSSDAQSDSGDGGKDGGNDSGGDSGKGDGGKDSGQDASPDGGSDSGEPPPPPKDEPDAAPPPPSGADQDERILEQLERAPTVQQEAAKKAASQHRVRGMADK